MFDLLGIPTVFDERVDPRLRAIVKRSPPSLHVVFAGHDAPLIDAMRNCYGVDLQTPDVAIWLRSGQLVASVAPSPHSDGLAVAVVFDVGEDAYAVTPSLIFPACRAVGASTRLNPIADAPTQFISALESLIFRRVMPAERIS